MTKLMYAALTITLLSSIPTVGAYAEEEAGNSPEPVVTSEGEEHAAVAPLEEDGHAAAEKPKAEGPHAAKERADAALGAAGGGEKGSSDGTSTEEENGEADPKATAASPEQNDSIYNTQTHRAYMANMKGAKQAEKGRYAHAKASVMGTHTSAKAHHKAEKPQARAHATAKIPWAYTLRNKN